MTLEITSVNSADQIKFHCDVKHYRLTQLNTKDETDIAAAYIYGLAVTSPALGQVSLPS
jgi:hypothetical protein